MTTLWLVGRRDDAQTTNWTLLGVFTDYRLAAQSCRTELDFVYGLRADTLSTICHDVIVDVARYPRCRSAF